ncbi:MAG TPA: sigma-70 family RNA polymerase sigma factor [Dysgonamonadaceae bacterium]|jgi:RNA polymerase sigma factor (sigma-70 family)|nr:sigma-70 family RNA polymerase sigma factor [Dysgonamonadaceae bacterium]
MGSIDHHWKKFVENGDEASFEAIYNSHVDDLFAYGMSLGFQRQTCKDAIQDTFIKLFLSRNDLRYIENVTGYLFKSFKNRLIDLARKNRSNDSIESIEDRFTIEVTVLDNIIESETRAIIKTRVGLLLNRLTTNQREAIYLKYVMGLSHKEIAEILNMREESARKLLYRAMEKLRQKATEDKLLDKTVVLTLVHLFCQLM